MVVTRILSYGQILSALRLGKVRIFGVEYDVSPEIRSYIEQNLPLAGHFMVGTAILAASIDVVTGASIVMFLPSGPPDPGVPVEGGNR